jgi:hypothetical protein
VEKIHAVATDPVILSSEGNVLCASSLIETTLLALGAPQVGDNTSLTWSECKSSTSVCEVKTTALGTLLYLKTEVNLGTAQFHNMKLLIKCSIFFQCEYEGLPTFHLLGATLLDNGPGNNGGMRGVETTLTSGPFDGPCPPGIVLDLFWEALEPVYVKS